MLALPIFAVSHPATIVGENELNFCVRDGNRWTLIPINTNFVETQACSFCASSSTQPQLGFSFPNQAGLIRGIFFIYPENRTSMIFCIFLRRRVLLFQLVKSSPRLISIGQLNVLSRLHLRPINDIVYVEPYSISGWEILS